MQRQRHTLKPLRARRRGLAMVPAAICLLLATLLLASSIKLTTAGRRQVGREQRQMQAEWLAAAGLERAAAALQADASYAGETWNVVAADLGGAHAAVVVITVEPAAAAENEKLVTAAATYPAASATPAGRTQQARVHIGAP